MQCPQCNDRALVRTKKYQARCLSCLHRFLVDAAEWKGLPESRKQHPGHTVWDSIAIFNYTGVPLFSWRGLITVIVVVGLPFAAVWFIPALHWGVLVFMAIIGLLLILLVLGWLQDKGKPSKQVEAYCACGYDLRGCTGSICPECGRNF